MIHKRTLFALEYEKIVLHIADLCKSEQGRKIALSLEPLSNLEEANKAFDLYREFCIWIEQNGCSKNSFTPVFFPDVSGFVDSANKSLDIDDFWALREMLRIAGNAFKSIDQENAPLLWPHLLELAKSQPFPDALLAALNRCISDDVFLKDESTPELRQIRNDLRKLHQSCIHKAKDYARQYNMEHYLQDEYMTISQDRYVLPLKSNFKGRMHGVIHDWSQTGETCYFEPIFLVEINNHLRELKRKEAQEERNILNFLASLLFDNIEPVKGCMRLLGLLDFNNAKKIMACNLDCHCPDFTRPEEGIELLNARHPLLLLARKNSGKNGSDKHGFKDAVRPLDIILRPSERVLIITGGNAGGKTVCLKTMGIAAAMAMSGLPVPCGKGSHMPWFNRVDAFIGDEQSLADNVSTFTAQIDHLAKAWKHLDSFSLVLMDEFGSGTDPAEGAALAQAVLDGFLDKFCFTLCATHFPALKTYALTRSCVSAASMLFDPKTNLPCFKLAYGQVGASQALLVAREHGLPLSILDRADHYLLQEGGDAASVLERLNALAVEREDEINKLKAEQAKLKTALDNAKQKIAREQAKLQTEIRKEIVSLMHAYKQEKLSARQTMKEMSKIRAGLVPQKEKTALLIDNKDFVIGQKVFHNIFKKYGIITEQDIKRNRAKIDMDGVHLWAEWNNLKAVESAKENTARQTAVNSEKAGSLTLDVRGMRSDEALLNVEKFLDRAILAGFAEAEIVHGRGTGALRRQIHDFLLDFPAVHKFSLAPESRGGDGMTIVLLK